MMKYFFVILCLLTLRAGAQDFEGYFSASLDFNQPQSNVHYLKDMSYIGLKLGYHRLLNQKFSIGGEFNWSTYSQYQPTAKTYPNYPSQNPTLTTDWFNYLYAYGLTINARYHFTYNHKVNPFVGVGLGGSFNKYVQYYNVYTYAEKKNGLLIRPEAGLLIRFNERRGLCGLIGAHYDYAGSGNAKWGSSTFTAYGFNLGIVILNW